MMIIDYTCIKTIQFFPKARVLFMETTIEELLDQNQALLETVTELQKEAKNRCNEMDKRLALSANKTGLKTFDTLSHHFLNGDSFYRRSSSRSK